MRYIAILMLLAICAGAKAQVAKIPFELIGNRMYVKVRVNNSDSLRFLFDTGGTGILIDSMVAEKAGVDQKGRKKTRAHGAGGARPSVSIGRQSLGLPSGISLKDVEFTMMDLSEINAGSRLPIAGILGTDLMDRYVTRIDFGAKQLLLYSEVADIDVSGYTAVPFRFYQGLRIPRFEVGIALSNGETVRGRAIFDSGAAATLLVFAPFNSYHGLEGKLGRMLPAPSMGLAAATSDSQAVIKGLEFNGFSFGEMAIMVSGDDGAKKSGAYLGLLGFDVIRRFDVVMDYRGKVIYLKPNELYGKPFSAAMTDYAMMEALKAKKASQKELKGPDAEQGRAFLESNKGRPWMMVLPSGLQYRVIRAGDGAVPGPRDRVTVHYLGTLVNGKIFDGSYLRGQPSTFGVNEVIAGWQQALQLMAVGSKWELYVPAELAYGTHTGKGTFPPGSAMVFELELLEIKK